MEEVKQHIENEREKAEKSVKRRKKTENEIKRKKLRQKNENMQARKIN